MHEVGLINRRDSSLLVSVVVPVFNQWHMVPELLRCLERQSSAGFEFELLLVDNGSDDMPRAGKDPDFASRCVCIKPGSYAARNYGAARARGNLFAFTDADCRPLSDWLVNAVNFWCKHDRSATIVAGHVSMVPTDRLSPNVFELYDMALGIPQARYVRRGFAATANLLVPRELFESVGGFDSRRFSGGDADFCRRAIRHGARLVYCPEAVVEHPARDNLVSLVTKVRRVKGGQLRAGSLWSRILYAVRAFLPPVRAWRNVIRASNLSVRQRLLVCILQARLWMTEAAEVFRLLAGRQPERR